MLTILWRRLGESFLQSRVAVLDTWFSHTLALDYNRYQKTKKKSTFVWHSLIKNYIRGVVPTRSARMAWYTDIDTVYVPLNWGKGHWVAAAIDLRLGHVFILDPLIIKNDKRKLPRHMKPIVEMLPIAIKEIVKKESLTCPVPKVFSYERVIDVYQNDRTGDCGPLTVKFIELHAQGLGLDGLTDETVDEMRMRFAVDVYDEFVVSLRG
ncbi:PREDICTED: uncharacterized protein LOC104787507 [Camelina sativa]|uniref:Uncharacterized protein LOC104787507 n=1 Tax=Camelina sativa TaxID=90675 RepID=A0ABM0Z790_CAMSA|nr:PREDICTED: uncharacterized protein LOC104787507 [Camelina sativa]